MTDDDEAALFRLHGLPPPGKGAPAAGRAAHRPVAGHSRTLDAACLYRELCRRGLTGREAARAVTTMLGTSRARILKYQQHAIEAANTEHDRRGAEFVVARHWQGMIRHSWHQLSPKARDALKPIVDYRLMGAHPPTT